MMVIRYFLTLSLSVCFASSAAAQSCQDYFAAEWGTPLDMSEADDVNNSFPTDERHDLSPYAFSNGILTTTSTGVDPWFRVLTRSINGSIADKTTRYGDHHPIDPSKYQQVVIRMNTDKASALQVFWDQANRTLGASAPVPTTPGWKTYVVNLNSGPWSNGFNYGIRIDPSTASGALIQIDYIYLTPAGCSNPDLRVAPVLQPDREGGEDHYSSVRGNPVNFDSLMDLEFIMGHSSASLFTSNIYQDSNNLYRRQDFFQGTNASGNGDPQLYLTFPGTRFPIDANRFKIACWTLDVLRPVNEFHSVQRLIWARNFGTSSIYYGSDDVVTKFTGESRYCLRLDSVPLEPALSAGQVHPWRNNDDGSGIDYLRLDPHEETVPTTYRLVDARLAAEHEAHTKFAIVVGGDRTAPVAVHYQYGNGPLTPIATLGVDRISNVVLWDTSALPEGAYYIYSTIGLNTYRSEAPVVVSHTTRAADIFAPALNVDSPLNGHRFNSTLQVAGYAVDTGRIATVEVHLNGKMIDSFIPENFDARARAQFPAAPFNSSAGFDRFIDTSNVQAGNHTVTITAWDTGGNPSVHTATITKTTTDLTANFSAPYQEAQPLAITEGAQPRPTPIRTPAPAQEPQTLPASARKASLNLRVANDRLSMYAVGINCSTVRLYASTSARKVEDLRKRGTLIHTVTGTNKLRGLSSRIPTLSSNKSIYFLADCGDGTTGSVKSINARSFRSKTRTSSASRVFTAIVKNYKASK